MSMSIQMLSSKQYQSTNLPNDVGNHDWICVKCNNLNFSFRKKCNRCKVQSREDNQQHLYADYCYYTQYYALGAHKCGSMEERRGQGGIEDPGSPVGKRVRGDEEIENREDHLPSVSPLVKKYGNGSEGKKKKGACGLFTWQLFGQESWSENEWPVLSPNLFHKDLFPTDDEEPSAEFVRSVEQMII